VTARAGLNQRKPKKLRPDITFPAMPKFKGEDLAFYRRQFCFALLEIRPLNAEG